MKKIDWLKVLCWVGIWFMWFGLVLGASVSWAADYSPGVVAVSCDEKYCVVAQEDLLLLVGTNASLSADLTIERASKVRRCAVLKPMTHTVCSCDATRMNCVCK